MMGFTIAIGGDIAPTPSNYSYFESADTYALLGNELAYLLRTADYCLFNLETPLTDHAAPIAKCGPNLIAPPKTAACLAAINPNVILALANNHILDQGYDGLMQTIETLDSFQLMHFGAEKSLLDASEPITIGNSDIQVGIYACAEHEFSIATDKKPGANPFDPLESFDHISRLKSNCDYVIVLYHGGKEHYRLPSPGLQRTCRKFAEKGADLIVCQHSHCIGSREIWSGSTILYGQGNFLFDYKNDEMWQTSLLLYVNVTDEGLETEFLPLKKMGCSVRLATGADAGEIASAFEERSDRVADSDYIDAIYRNYASETVGNYLKAFIPHPIKLPFKFVDKLCGHALTHKLANRRDALAQINYIECEAHRELFLTALKELWR